MCLLRLLRALSTLWRVACRPDHLRLHRRLHVLLQAGGRAEYDAFQEISRIEERLISDERWRGRHPGRDLNRETLERWIADNPRSFLQHFRRLRGHPPCRVRKAVGNPPVRRP